MLNKTNQIKTDRTFKRVMSGGKKYYSQNSIWFFLESYHLKKIGFIVSNKVSPKASRRNKIKRNLRGFIGDNLNHLIEGYLVVMIRKDYRSNRSLYNDCADQLKKITKTNVKP